MLDRLQIGQIYTHTTHCSYTVQASQSHQIIIQHGQTETTLPLQQVLETLDKKLKASAPYA